MSDRAEKIWWTRVNRYQGPVANRELADACHRFLCRVAPDRPENGWPPPSEVLEAASAEYRAELGVISGAGPYPEG